MFYNSETVSTIKHTPVKQLYGYYGETTSCSITSRTSQHWVNRGTLVPAADSSAVNKVPCYYTCVVPGIYLAEGPVASSIQQYVYDLTNKINISVVEGIDWTVMPRDPRSNDSLPVFAMYSKGQLYLRYLITDLKFNMLGDIRANMSAYIVEPAHFSVGSAAWIPFSGDRSERAALYPPNRFLTDDDGRATLALTCDDDSAGRQPKKYGFWSTMLACAVRQLIISEFSCNHYGHRADSLTVRELNSLCADDRFNSRGEHEIDWMDKPIDNLAAGVAGYLLDNFCNSAKPDETVLWDSSKDEAVLESIFSVAHLPFSRGMVNNYVTLPISVLQSHMLVSFILGAARTFIGQRRTPGRIEFASGYRNYAGVLSERIGRSWEFETGTETPFYLPAYLPNSNQESNYYVLPGVFRPDANRIPGTESLIQDQLKRVIGKESILVENGTVNLSGASLTPDHYGLIVNDALVFMSREGWVSTRATKEAVFVEHQVPMSDSVVNHNPFPLWVFYLCCANPYGKYEFRVRQRRLPTFKDVDWFKYFRSVRGIGHRHRDRRDGESPHEEVRPDEPAKPQSNVGGVSQPNPPPSK